MGEHFGGYLTGWSCHGKAAVSLPDRANERQHDHVKAFGPCIHCQRVNWSKHLQFTSPRFMSPQAAIAITTLVELVVQADVLTSLVRLLRAAFSPDTHWFMERWRCYCIGILPCAWPGLTGYPSTNLRLQRAE